MARATDQLAVYFGLKEPERPPDPAEIRAAQALLRRPLWWVVLLLVGAVFGAAYEGIAAALGDGNFNLSAVLPVAAPVVLAPLGVQLFGALRRPS
jgi:hypothetical protein